MAGYCAAVRLLEGENQLRGFSKALEHEVHTPITYRWRLGDDLLVLNDWLAHTVEIRFLGERRCIACGRKVTKLYQNGYCFPCVTSLAETDLCIVKPHECHHHLGTCRDNEFAETQCMIPHYVYLAVSSHAKVGLTRKNRQWIRWVDQGAHQAMLFAQLPTRKAAGEFEMEVAKNLSDKTDWRKMVQGVHETVDLTALAQAVYERLPDTLRPFVLDDFAVCDLQYPVCEGETPKAKSLDLQKESVSGRLIGIRGQYLLFPHGCLNIKKHAGMLLEANPIT